MYNFYLKAVYQSSNIDAYILNITYKSLRFLKDKKT